MKFLITFFFLLISLSAFSEPEKVHDYDRCWDDKKYANDPEKAHLATGWTDCDVSELGSEGTTLYDQEDEYYNDHCRDQLMELGHYSSAA